MNQNRNKKNGRHSIPVELILAIAAISLSVFTLGVTVFQTDIMREQMYASVWPYLEIMPSFTNEGVYATATNKGVGPALVKSFVVEVDGKPVKTWKELLTLFLGEKLPFFAISTINNRVIAPNESIKLIHIHPDPSLAKLRTLGDRVSIICVYASVYDEYWMVKDNVHSKVSKISIDPEREFQN